MLDIKRGTKVISPVKSAALLDAVVLSRAPPEGRPTLTAERAAANAREQDSKNKNISIHSIAYFKECWEASGLAKITGTHSLPVLLRVRGH